MKTTFRIARLELNTLFYSPIAWFLAIVFLFQAGLDFTTHMQEALTNQSLGGDYLNYMDYMTDQTFAGMFGLFVTILSKVYLYLPLLTMGLISREVSSGTIKLLFSSPIKVSQIVYGKFLAMAVYNLLLILILAFFGITGMVTIKSADLGLIISGLFGIYLLLCAYSAIGLFMSCLTSYQIVAAISTLVVFAMLNYVGTVWQSVDFVRDLTYFLSIAGRSKIMLEGLISTKDVMYFVIITAMFIAFSIIKLQSGRDSKSMLKLAGRYAGVFAIALFVGYMTNIPGFIGYLDLTADKTQTLRPNSEKILKELGDEPIQITSYINLLDQRYWNGKPDQRNNDKDRWEKYRRFKSNISLKYVYYYENPLDPNNDLSKQYPGKSIKDIAKTYASSFKADLSDFESPEEINKQIDLSHEQFRYVMKVDFKGKSTFLRLFNDPAVFPLEAETIAALKRLTVKIPKIAFVDGEFERSKDKLGPTDYGTMANDITYRYSLVNQGFDDDTISLNDQDIPQGIAALVIADPRAAFTPVAMAKIQKYIAEGGNLLIAGEPGKQDVVNPLLKPLGVQMMDGQLLQKSKDFPLSTVRSFLTPTSVNFTIGLQKAYKDSLGINMPGAVALSYVNNGPFTIKPLLMTNGKDTWNKRGIVVIDSAAITYSKENGDDHNALPTALGLTRKVGNKEQRIVVVGDADFLSMGSLNREGIINPAFGTQLFRWFTYGQFPIDAGLPPPKDNRLLLSDDGISTMKIAYLGVLPGVLLICAAVFLIRRKRK